MDNSHSAEQLSFEKRAWTIAGISALVIALLVLLKVALSTLMIIIAGILLAVYFLGCASLLQKLKIPHKLSVVLSVLLNIVLLAGFFWFMGARIQSQVQELSQKIPQSVQQVKSQLKQSALGRKALDIISSGGNQEKTRQLIKQFFSSTFGILTDIYIFFLLAVFFTASPGIYRKGVIQLVPERGKEKSKQILKTIHSKFKGWIKGKIIAFFIISIFTGVALWILGMPLVLTLALIAGLLNFVPNFGPIIALIPAVLVAFTQGGNMVWWVIGLYTAVQILQSAVTLPLIQQKMVQVPPVLVIFAQVILGLTAGLWGVLVAIPVIIIIMTMVKKVYLKESEG